MRALLLLGALALLLPTASACSLVEGAQGYYLVRDLATKEERSYRVVGAMPAPDCGIENPRALDGPRLYWSESDGIHVGEASRARLLPAPGPVAALSAENGSLLVLTTGGARYGAFLVNGTTGATERLPLELAPAPNRTVALVGDRLVVLDPVQEGGRLSVYNATARRWELEGRLLPGVTPVAGFRAPVGGDGWLLASTDRGFLALSLDGDAVVNVTGVVTSGPGAPFRRPLGIDDGYLYVAEGGFADFARILRAPLEGEGEETVASHVRQPVGPFEDGRLVHSRFATPPEIPFPGAWLVAFAVGLVAMRLRKA